MADLYQLPNPTRPAAVFGAGFDAAHPRGDDGKFVPAGSGDGSDKPSKLDAGGRAKALKKQIADDKNPPSDDRRKEVLRELEKAEKSSGKPPRWWAALRKMLGVGYKKGFES